MQDKYAKLEKIAEGSYGVIYKGRDNATNQLVTLKKFKKHNAEQGIPQNCLRQIQMLRMLEGSHRVIQIKDVVLSSNGSVIIVYNFHESSLKSFLGSSGSAYNPKAFLQEILQAVQTIHDNQIIHRDLKPSNILMTKTGALRIADFGLAREEEQVMTNEVGTLSYRAPELLLGETRYTKAVDLWAVGCIFYELIKRTTLFTGKTDSELLAKIWTVLGTANSVGSGLPIPLINKLHLPPPDEAQRQQAFEGIEGHGLDLLLRLLDLNQHTRIKAADALKHPYFSEKHKQ